MENKLTQERLKYLLHYDPITGVIKNNVNRKQSKKGKEAGCKHHTGYIYICLDSVVYSAHRLAWFYMEGYWPENIIDYINRVRDDNRWSNLRHTTIACNNINCSKQKNNKSGVIGVSYREKVNKWVVQININKKRSHVGHYREFNDAVMARWESEKKHNYPNCNTTSTAYLYLKKIDDNFTLPEDM